MKISRIKIENFRSIKAAEFNTTNFNILVGQNNCGKTNLFEAIEFFFNGPGRGGLSNDLKFQRNSELELLVEIEFSGAQHGANNMQHEGNRTKIQNALDEADAVVITRSSTNPKKRKVLVNGNEVNPGTGFDPALNDFLPKFEYINTKQYYDSVAKYSKSTPVGIMLSGVLSTILETNEQYMDFQNRFRDLFEGQESEIKTQFEIVGGHVMVNLQKQFPDTTKVKFEVSPPVFDDLLKNFETTVDDGIETTAEEKGDGMQRALMLAIIQAYAEFRREREDPGKSFMFFIDEAELHLHPTAQRNLKEVLIELSADADQVFMNTHSSVFVADDNENQIIFKVEKNEGETAIDTVEQADKPYVVFELLGGNPSDLLLPNNFLIVEGVSEFELLTRIIKRFYPDQPRVQIIQAHGDIDQTIRTINAIEKAFTPLNTSIYREKQIILIDAPSEQTQGGVTTFLKVNNHLVENDQFHQIPFRDIEQYYPDQSDDTYGNWRKTQAQLDETNDAGKKLFTGRRKKQLAKVVGDNISQEQFENNMPIVFSALAAAWEKAF
ncbi:AAA family ATPase [Reichenbachiella sp.]|uniref:ATP-dependent nuclease n=1 Tax=Reichenbachiella sp. TaxID=2184521 RepID=UPI003299DF37